MPPYDSAHWDKDAPARRNDLAMSQATRSSVMDPCNGEKYRCQDHDRACWMKRTSLPDCWLADERKRDLCRAEMASKKGQNMYSRSFKLDAQGSSSSRPSQFRKQELLVKQRSVSRLQPRQKSKSISWGEYYVSIRGPREKVSYTPERQWKKQQDSLKWKCTVARSSTVLSQWKRLFNNVVHWISTIFSPIVPILFFSFVSRAANEARKEVEPQETSQVCHHQKDQQELQNLLSHAQQSGFVVLTNSASGFQPDFPELHSHLEEVFGHGLETASLTIEARATRNNIYKEEPDTITRRASSSRTNRIVSA